MVSNLLNLAGRIARNAIEKCACYRNNRFVTFQIPFPKAKERRNVCFDESRSDGGVQVLDTGI